MKMLNELNRAFIRNADYCKKKKKELETIKRNQEKNRKFICGDKN